MAGHAAYPVLLRCAPGLAHLLQHEMKFRKIMERGARPMVLHQRNHDLVFLKNVVQARNLPQLRIAEESGFCLLHGQYKVSASQLDRAAEALRHLRKPVHLAVTADGRHFDRRDMERFFSRELMARGVRLTEHGTLAWLFLIDEKFYLMLREAEQDEAPQRHLRKREREGSLPATIAAAMAFAARPQARETVLDPCCGSGTLLAEACGLQPHAGRLIGFDLDEAAVSVAKTNLKSFAAAESYKGDGTATGLPDKSVDLALANLPFGRRFGHVANNPALYEGILRELVRTARRPNWRAVLLTSDTQSLRAALKAVPELKAEELFAVKVRGEPAHCCQVVFR
jgi:23S rRNA G2445 N2-methylase RlmL